MQVVTSSLTTTTTYIGRVEEVQVAGSTTTKIVYFSVWGQMVAEDDNTNWYYFINDGLTSITVMVNYAGVVAAQLFAPYGQTRWAGGTMPTSYGFTGQRSDSATGLDFYRARYYDPLTGCFTKADTVLAGLNRYAYAGGNPTTRTDPSGHTAGGGCHLDALDCFCNQGNNATSSPECNGGDSGSDCVTDNSCNTGGASASGSRPCGVEGATCSDNAGACAGKSHCVILINGTDSSATENTNGFDYDVNDWQAWIKKISDEFGGDVGFILLETGNASHGADLIHTTLQSLAAMSYHGDINLIGASAGSGAVFTYLDRAAHHYYSGQSDPVLHSFVALQAVTKTDSYVCGVNPFCGLYYFGVSVDTGWNGDTSGADDYLTQHPETTGVYEWDNFDPISTELDGSKFSSYTYSPVSFENPHTYIEHHDPDAHVLCALSDTAPGGAGC